jgi:hypothetical protein
MISFVVMDAELGFHLCLGVQSTALDLPQFQCVPVLWLQRQNKPAELIAKFMDSRLRAGGTKVGGSTAHGSFVAAS